MFFCMSFMAPPAGGAFFVQLNSEMAEGALTGFAKITAPIVGTIFSRRGAVWHLTSS